MYKPCFIKVNTSKAVPTSFWAIHTYSPKSEVFRFSNRSSLLFSSSSSWIMVTSLLVVTGSLFLSHLMMTFPTTSTLHSSLALPPGGPNPTLCMWWWVWNTGENPNLGPYDMRDGDKLYPSRVRWYCWTCRVVSLAYVWPTTLHIHHQG